MNVYDRFERYVTFHTTSDSRSGLHPSFEGEFDLANYLQYEMSELGMKGICVDSRAYVYGYLPATPGCENAPALGFIAHMDTSEEAAGKNVKPILHPHYSGEDIIMNPHADRTSDVAIMRVSDFPFLATFKGENVVTSDGTTLLGADDKAGIAEIMSAVDTIIRKNIPHGELWVAFTPDEEIGEGADFFDLDRFKAKYAYTVDGGDVDCIEYENFNAASAHIVIKGRSVHPGDAKGVMVNASTVALELHTMLPEKERPETTENREGFFHLVEMSGRVSGAKLEYIIRDHDRELFEARKRFMVGAVEAINGKYGAGTATVEIKDSYYNMLEQIIPHMHLVDNAMEAMRAVGLEPRVVPIRGGTDGARLSFMGLPCPNLGTGGYNFHGPYECITIERMQKSVDIIVKIVEVYSRK